MKKIYATTGLLATLLLASLNVLSQTQSRADLEKSYLAPSAEDRIRYAEFLKRPNTGLIRLLPREKFERGGYYSFTRLTHEYVNESDLSLEHGQFKVGFARKESGFMVSLGDVPIETVNSETPGVTFFAAYKSAKEETLARQEIHRLSRGAEIDGMPVVTQLPVKADSTYLLRSINYGTSDVLVAFRVVRVDADGSAVIAWKILNKYLSPKTNPTEPKTVG